ncbi:hypothetical protein BBJ28_00019921 [Nothophytophthora sp. Chile5]|nr:hypothetical protein BBJ28_00019921 [Nothophytophthora sp. Chile5]
MTEHQEQIDRVKAQIEDSTEKTDFYLTGLTKRVEEYEKEHTDFEPAGQYLKSALDASRAATQKMKTDGKDLSEKAVPMAVDSLQQVRESLESLKQRAITYDDKYTGSKGQHAVETVHELVNSGRQHATEGLEMASDQLTKLREAVENMASQAAHGTQVAMGEATRLAEKGDEKLDVSGKASGVVQKVRALDERMGVSATAAKVDAKVTGGLGSKVVSTTMEMVSESVEYISETLQNAKLAAQQSGTAQHVESKATAAAEAAAEKKTEVVETFVDTCEEGEAKASEVKEKTEQQLGEAADKTEEKAKEMRAKVTGEPKEPSGEGAVRATKEKGSEVMDAAKQKAAGMAESTKPTTGSAQDTAKETGQQAKGAIEEAGQKAKHTAKETGQQAKGAIEEAGQKPKHTAKETAQKAKDSAKETGQQAKGAAQEGAEKASGHGGGKNKRSGHK